MHTLAPNGLPVGYTDRSGRAHREFSLRKMTGVEEELLYDAELAAGELISALLAACLVRLGDLEHVDRKLMGDLYVGDRNYLLLELRRMTLGDKLRARYRCPHCDSACAVVEDLSAISVRRLPEGTAVREATLQLDDGYRDARGKQHRRIVLGPPRGSDEEFVSKLGARQPLRARDALVLRCVRSFGELSEAELSGSGIEILRSLTLGDRRRITGALNDLTLGPDFRRQISCSQCGAEFETLLDASSFFEDG